MTASATIAWMKEKSYLKRWVLPVNGLNKEKDLVKFSGRPVGNSPEFMPWDYYLNNDLKLSCDRHVILTNNLPDTNPKFFSMSTPNRGAQCWMSLIHTYSGGVPRRNRIIQYLWETFVSMEAVRMADGIDIKGV